jgi:hypothetical protein
VALLTAYPELLHLQISARSHDGPSDRIAFVEVFGVDSERTRRRQFMPTQAISFDASATPSTWRCGSTSTIWHRSS